MRRKSNVLFFFLITNCAVAQSPSDARLLKHLYEIGEFREGLLFIDGLQQKVDSTYFFEGLFYYELRDPVRSAEAFSKVNPNHDQLGTITGFYNGLQYAYASNYPASSREFYKTRYQSRDEAELRKLELAGVSLLDRNYERYDSLVSLFDAEYHLLNEYQAAIHKMSTTLRTKKIKSPALAGILSAIIPGGGKFYQGKIGSGAMALVTTGIFGLQALEGYKKSGVESAPFIIFSSAFVAFYTANIWGSVVSVRVGRQEFNDEMDETILVNMHIPLRLLYH